MDFGILEKKEPSILHGLGYIGRLEKKNGNKQFFILRRQNAKRRKAAVNSASHLRRQIAKVPKAAVNQTGGCCCLRKEVERHGENPTVFDSTYWGRSRNTIFLYRIGLPLFVSYTKLMHSGIRQILWRPKNERDCSGAVIVKMLKFQGIPEAVPKRTQRDRQFCTLALVLTYKKHGSLY